MISILNPRTLSTVLSKVKMLASIPSQSVVTNNGDRFDLLKLGLYPVPPHQCADDQDTSLENVELVQIQARRHYQRHFHKHSDAVIYIISGSGKLLLGSEVVEYRPNLKFAIPQNVMHGFVTNEETLFLSIQTPHIIDPVTGEIDIYYENEGLSK